MRFCCMSSHQRKDASGLLSRVLAVWQFHGPQQPVQHAVCEMGMTLGCLKPAA